MHYLFKIKNMSKKIFFKPKPVQNCSPSGSSAYGVLWARIGLSFPSPEDLPNTGIKPASLALQTDSLQTESPGKPITKAKHTRNFLTKNKNMSFSEHAYSL